MNIELFKHIYFRMPVLARLILTILLVMSLFGLIIHFVEPNEFPTIFDGIWWAFVTGSTVGYGDYVPLSTTGRMIAILLILTGGGLITFYISIFAAATVKHERDLSEGKVTYNGKKHIIFIGWNEKTRLLIELLTKSHPEIDIILIDQTLSRMSYQHYPIHFVQGDATDDATLIKANIKMAQKVIITADSSQNEKQADHFTILSTVAIRGNNKDIPIIAEILTTKQIDNALRAGATTILRPNDFMSHLLYHEVFKTHSMPFETVIHQLANQQFQQITISSELENKSFISALCQLKEEEKLLIGIIRDKEWKMNPPADFQLKKNDILITITEW
ncbi:potassium channel family protein [Ornithinibacillus halophilus]|uniref:Voltage-gated potassium channel n=1 Tax=Ornithinibacillus halophilus TaxID=930117 RepID=A0A1M5K5W0_9BACI|nr:potassium channel family protein [Ornithinibacillus halophilus]SHG48175.1 voltage-gated potassium channel [Ornithinibacillus halophilus]